MYFDNFQSSTSWNLTFLTLKSGNLIWWPNEAINWVYIKGKYVLENASDLVGSLKETTEDSHY